jgi:hypothetical protein
MRPSPSPMRSLRVATLRITEGTVGKEESCGSRAEEGLHRPPYSVVGSSSTGAAAKGRSAAEPPNSGLL